MEFRILQDFLTWSQKNGRRDSKNISFFAKFNKTIINCFVYIVFWFELSQNIFLKELLFLLVFNLSYSDL